MELLINSIDDRLGEQVYFLGVTTNMYSVEEILNRVVSTMENKLDSLIADIAVVKTKVENLADRLEGHMEDEDNEISLVKKDVNSIGEIVRDHTKEEVRATKKAVYIIIAAFTVIATAGVTLLISLAPGLAKILLHLIGG